LKLFLCTKHDIVGSMMLNAILPRLAPHHSIEVLLANRHRPEADVIPELQWMKFFEQDLPAQLLFPLLDAGAAGRLPAPASPAAWLSFDALSERHGVPITSVGHIARADVLTEHTQRVQPDLIVSFQFGFIFKPQALEIPRLGALNLHSGALPHRAGVNPTFWCMKDGDREVACTLHWIDQGIDSGNVVDIRSMPLDYTKSFFSNWMTNYRQGADMICDAVERLAAGDTLPSLPQDMSALQYVPTPTPDDFKVFAERGRRMIDPQDYLDIVSRYLPRPEKG